MKSKELKTYNLPNEIAPLSAINAKPSLLFLLLIVVGIVAIILKIQIIYCVSMIVIGVVCLLFMPKITLIEFYNDYFVMYNRADKTKCVLIYNNEVKSWYYSWSTKKDELVVELEDGTIEKIEGFSKSIFETYMNRYLKDKHIKKK